jgi:signal-transduction protein with cAMP-binding, CBS, and nucleotidyltransferase domain
MLISNYLLKEKEHFQSFLSSIQIFKMFSKKAFEKFMGNLSIKFLNAGEYLYKFGDDARYLHIVYKGKASRKVIVELDKINKIPMLKYSKIIKIMSKSYEHKI